MGGKEFVGRLCAAWNLVGPRPDKERGRLAPHSLDSGPTVSPSQNETVGQSRYINGASRARTGDLLLAKHIETDANHGKKPYKSH